VTQDGEAIDASLEGSDDDVSLTTIAREWTRIGMTGFGGPPTHILLLRRLCVGNRRWMSSEEFEDGIAATNLLPGPASTQLAIFCGWRLRGPRGAVVAGSCFIIPGLIIIVALSILFLADHPPLWVQGAAAGAGAAVPAVALAAALGLAPASWARIGTTLAEKARWVIYAGLAVLTVATVGTYVVIVLVACVMDENLSRHAVPGSWTRSRQHALAPVLATLSTTGGALAWVAFKVGALSYGGGFVIIPLMQADAVGRYHWMTDSQFLSAVALGQITPGPVVQTVSVVGYAAAGLAGAVLAAVVAFAPSFLFVLAGGRYFDRLRSNETVRAFLTGAGPAAIGAIAGSAITLTLALSESWQFAVLAAAAVWFVVARRNVPVGLVAAGVIGVLAVLAGAPVG
jgi:chromate transporter